MESKSSLNEYRILILLLPYPHLSTKLILFVSSAVAVFLNSSTSHDDSTNLSNIHPHREPRSMKNKDQLVERSKINLEREQDWLVSELLGLHRSLPLALWDGPEDNVNSYVITSQSLTFLLSLTETKVDRIFDIPSHDAVRNHRAANRSGRHFSFSPGPSLILSSRSKSDNFRLSNPS